MNPGAGSASFHPDSNYPNAIVVVSDFNFKEFFRTEVNAYCDTIAAIEVAFFGAPVANSGFDKEKKCNFTYNLTVTSSVG